MSTRRALVGLLVVVALTAANLALGSGPAPPERTSLAAAGTVHLTAAGDYGSGTRARGVLDLVGDLAPDVHVALGDLSYGQTGREQDWCDLVTAAVGPGFPFELVAGNHESNGMNGNINDFSACLPNQLPGLVGTYGRQWYVDVPAGAPLVRLVAVSPGLPFPDGTWSYAAGSARYEWTARAVDGARAAGVPWVVVTMHRPCPSVGQYECGPLADLTNLLLDRRVDLVLSGHEHLYQRSHQLATGPGCPALVPGTASPSCVVDTDSDLVQGRGTVLATVGTGGIDLRDVDPADPEAPYFARWSGRNHDPSHGVLEVTVDAAQLVARFVAVPPGTATDVVRVRRDTAPPPPVPQPLALDRFSRTSGAGWGVADVGGPWSQSGGPATWTVDGGQGRSHSGPGGGGRATMDQVTSVATDLTLVARAVERPTGGGVYVSAVGRRIAGAGDYRAKVRFLPDGTATLSLVQADASGREVVLAPPVAIPGPPLPHGGGVHVRMQVTGSGPTTLRARAWPVGAPEPSAWAREATDTTAGLQGPGAVGLVTYVSSSATGATTVAVDDLVAVVP
ncbi:metallophosphoesterase [Thalassiella azotivora]